MPRKCSVGGCDTNFDSERKQRDACEKIPVYGFPEDYEERCDWVKAIPNKEKTVNNITKNMGVCGRHWPEGVMMKKRNRHLVPAVPPSIFPNVRKSQLPPKQRTKRSGNALSKARKPDIDELEQFQQIDKFSSASSSDFVSSLLSKLEEKGKVAAKENEVVLLSEGRNGPIFHYTVIFTLHRVKAVVTKASFEAYKGLKSVSVPFLQNRTLSTWSQLQELLRFISADASEESDQQINFLERQVELLNTPKNSRLYEQSDLCLALSWCSRSRALYADLRNVLRLPSESTLRNITRTAKGVANEVLFQKFFSAQDRRSSACFLIVDEVYVKASLVYSGGELFGYAADAEGKLANTLLCVMVKCLFTGKKFLAKMIPCHALSSQFQFGVVSDLIESLEKSGATVLGIINDNSKVNQSYFKLFPGFTASTPWMVPSFSDPSRPLFLLFDPVHLLKNIRNNWITDKTKTLCFPSNGSHSGERKEATWVSLEELYQREEGALVKLSKLNKVAVQPSNQEKQKVSLALRVFCDETRSALMTSAGSTDGWKDTADFIKLVLKLWKLWNCKSPAQHIHLRDPDRIPYDTGENGERARLLLEEWANIAQTMRASGRVRIKSLTVDTADALAWTCRGFSALAQHLITTTEAYRHQYVCFGDWQQDDLEHHFGHFRRSAGCNYYVTVREVFSTHALDRARLLLSLIDLSEEVNTTHSCDLCTKPFPLKDLELIDDMAEDFSPNKMSPDEAMAVYYIAGYVAHHHAELSGTHSDCNDEMKSYFDAINRGGLTCPSEECLYFVLLAYYFFKKSETVFCRKRLAWMLTYFPSFFGLQYSLPVPAIQRIVNIFMKSYAIKSTQASTSASSSSRRKVLKLTSKSN